MATTGAQRVTATSVAPGGGEPAWANPGNANGSDNVYATVTINPATDGFFGTEYLRHDFSGLAALIAAGSVINGMILSVEGKSPDSAAQLYYHILDTVGGVFDNGTTHAFALASASDAVYTQGSSSTFPTGVSGVTQASLAHCRLDLMGAKPSPSTEVVSVDDVSIEVFYTPPGGDFPASLRSNNQFQSYAFGRSN